MDVQHTLGAIASLFKYIKPHAPYAPEDGRPPVSGISRPVRFRAVSFGDIGLVHWCGLDAGFEGGSFDG